MAIAADLCIPIIIGFLQGEYTGSYRNNEQIFTILKQHGCPALIYNDLVRVYTIGAPAKFLATSTVENFYQYLAYGNHQSAVNKPTAVTASTNKEVDRSHVIPLPPYIAPFVSNLHLSPLGLLERPEKKDRIIIDHSFLPNDNCISVNQMHIITDEIPLLYGTTFQRHLQRIHNLRISYPDITIYLWDDDVATAFRHTKYNPFIAGAFAYMTEDGLFIPTSQTFGSVTSPSNWEAIAQARAFLSEIFSNESFAHLLESQKFYLDQVKWAEPEKTSTSNITAICCSDLINTGVFRDGKAVNTPHYVYVDDTLVADILPRIPQAITASTASCFIMLGEPVSIRPSPLSIEKFKSHECSPVRRQLGVIINTNNMTVSVPADKLDQLRAIIEKFPPHREQFTILEGAKLLGNLDHLGAILPWFRHVYINVRRTFNDCLKNKFNDLRQSRKYIDLRDAINSHDENISKAASRALCKLQAKHLYASTGKKDQAYLTPNFKNDLALIRAMISNPSLFMAPIPHIIPRTSSFRAFCDSCEYGAGGYSQELGFIWHIFWPKHCHEELALLEDDTHINIKEFLSVIITFALARRILTTNPSLALDTYPTITIFSDNSSAVSWASKGISSKNRVGHHIARIMCALRIQSNLGLHVEHIPGVDNVISDQISRIVYSPVSPSSVVSKQVHRIQQEHQCLQDCSLCPIPSKLNSLVMLLLSKHAGRQVINWRVTKEQLIPDLPFFTPGSQLWD
jgi:hypothetical protein